MLRQMTLTTRSKMQPAFVLSTSQGSDRSVLPGVQADLLLPLPTLIAIEVLVFSLIEAKRYEGFKKTGKSGFLGSFPFDPAGLDSPANREKEIKNGRLGNLSLLICVCSFAEKASSVHHRSAS